MMIEAYPNELLDLEQNYTTCITFLTVHGSKIDLISDIDSDMFVCFDVANFSYIINRTLTICGSIK